MKAFVLFLYEHTLKYNKILMQIQNMELFLHTPPRF